MDCDSGNRGIGPKAIRKQKLFQCEKSAKTMTAPLKSKKCRHCKKPFVPFKPLQTVCSPACALELVKINRGKAERKELRDAKEKAKTKGQWLKEAQQAFNSYIRARDADLPCISCGRFHQGQYHAGHYRATSVAPALRFHEDNVHKQCSACNTHLHGNLLEYRSHLIRRVGAATVDFLEGQHEPKKYTIQDLQEIKRVYSAKARELRRGINK